MGIRRGDDDDHFRGGGEISPADLDLSSIFPFFFLFFLSYPFAFLLSFFLKKKEYIFLKERFSIKA